MTGVARSREHRDTAGSGPGRRARNGKGFDSLPDLLSDQLSVAANDKDGNSAPATTTRKKSGKSRAAVRAVEASSVELTNFGNCLICFNPIGLTACGLWVIPEKDEKGGDIMASRYTCSVACEKIQEAKPRYLGTVIKTRVVTSFAPYSDNSDS